MTDTPLNPDARRVAFEAVQAIDGPASIGSMEIVDVAVSAYLAVAQPLMTTQEELDAMPHETVIRDSQDFVFEKIALHNKDPEWWCTTDFLNETKVTLPVRVLYIPEVKP